MDKYPIEKGFAPQSKFRPPVCGALLPLINGGISLMRLFSSETKKHEKLRISVDGGSIEALLIRPLKTPAPAPCLVFFHGGGFVMKAAPSQYALAREYAEGAGCLVLFVNYRLAPRHKFPTPLFDCLAAYRYAIDNADALEIDKSRVAVGGDSAGGGLAAGVCLLARDKGLPLPCLQMLVYPVLDRRMETDTMREYVDTPMWNARLTKKMWRWYIKDGAEDAVYASPCEAENLAGLPISYIETAEFDCLRGEAEVYAERLRAAGVPVTLRETKGTMHGYDTKPRHPITRESVAARVDFLKKAF